MIRDHTGTRGHIIDTAEKLLSEGPSSEVRLADVAERAHVGVQTIYYHFASRNQLIAEAQASAYFRLTQPLHGLLTIAEKALEDHDPETFWSAVGDNIMLAWSYSQSDDRWRIPKLLLDIWADPKIQREFTEILEVQLERWINVIELAKPLGWIDPEIDTYALLTSCWAASIGQALFVGSPKIHFTPQSIRDFYVNIAISKD